MSYAIYLRKSRADIEAEARGEGETLARHQMQLLELARKLSLDIGAIYKELVSGETIAARPVMQQLISEVSAGKWDGVLCMEVERLARGDTMDQGLVSQSFKFSGTKIITPAKIYDPENEFDEEYFEFSLFMSRREYKTIRRRMQAGRMASVREGNYIGSLPPYGYKKVHSYEERSFTLEPIPEEAETVRLIYELYTEKDMGYSKIATYLNKLSIPPRRTDTWSASSIKDIIENPVYCGKIRWDRRKSKKALIGGKIEISRPKSEGMIFPGKHQPLISEELWNTAQEVPSKVPHTSGQFNKPVKNPFVGLLFCGMCGHALVRRPYKDKPPHYMCNHNGCVCKSSSENDIEEALIYFLKKQYAECRILLDKKQSTPVEKTYSERNIASELEKIKKQQERLYDLLEQGIYSAEIFAERSDKLKKRKQELEMLALQENKSKKAEIMSFETCISLNTIINDFRRISDPIHKNKLLKKVIKRIDYIKTVGGRHKKSYIELQIELLF